MPTVSAPPRGAHPVEAPFKRSTVNDSITGAYIVEIATVSGPPDTVLYSNNGLIDVQLYFQGGLPRPIAVDVGTINGQIKLAVPELQHAQYLNMHVHSINGATTVALPSSYRGFLRLHSVNGHIEIGDSLQKHSKRISGDHGADSKEELYYVDGGKSRDDTHSKKVCEYDTGDGKGESTRAYWAASGTEKSPSVDFAEREDNCLVKTVSGSIKVGFYDTDWFEMEEEEEMRGAMAWARQNQRSQCCVVA